MADLPRLAADDVRALVAAAAAHDVVLVRADDGRHTNALALTPPGCLATAFGRADSFDAHVAAARAAGLRVAVVDNARVAFDVDGPEDHARLMRRRARAAALRPLELDDRNLAPAGLLLVGARSSAPTASTFFQTARALRARQHVRLRLDSARRGTSTRDLGMRCCRFLNHAGCVGAARRTTRSRSDARRRRTASPARCAPCRSCCPSSSASSTLPPRIVEPMRPLVARNSATCVATNILSNELLHRVPSVARDRQLEAKARVVRQLRVAAERRLAVDDAIERRLLVGRGASRRRCAAADSACRAAPARGPPRG